MNLAYGFTSALVMRPLHIHVLQRPTGGAGLGIGLGGTRSGFWMVIQLLNWVKRAFGYSEYCGDFSDLQVGFGVEVLGVRREVGVPNIRIPTWLRGMDLRNR